MQVPIELDEGKINVLVSRAPHPADTWTVPHVQSSFDRGETKHIKDAFLDALLLARQVDTNPEWFVKTIFKKYFFESDYATVVEIIHNILGPDMKGSRHLRSVSAVHDYDNQYYGYSCTDSTVTATFIEMPDGRGYLVICGSAFLYGGIGKGYANAASLTCDMFDRPGMTLNAMLPLGGILLHEFTHYKKLLSPPLWSEAMDHAYAFKECRDLINQPDPSRPALYNADSYTYFLLELFWSSACGCDFDDEGRKIRR
ncbi:hypothetical protein DCS_08183 [Drechmeria coniospora]|uniref:Lysine-specific metallo-endopeptidase domain-containing protein n=1 Tax=Drechmeria coniospora TaxID=98403 RepID=A0A151GGJ8_DRECN|nr:hypothetical protein DCS_08183 [Drechmeria coniospora]KYK56215.1 hypothetical protein DCS_08183 [Drechmeria coniospora]